MRGITLLGSLVTSLLEGDVNVLSDNEGDNLVDVIPGQLRLVSGEVVAQVCNKSVLERGNVFVRA